MCQKGKGMDLRVERTKNSIKEAFLQLRKEKPLEKIFVKELSERAYINKATFYLHYKDIYDLADKIENEFVESVIGNVAAMNDFIGNSRESMEKLVYAMTSQSEMIRILFSGSRASFLEEKIENYIKAVIYEKNPDFSGNLKYEMILSMIIHGGFHTYKQYIDNNNVQEIVQIMGDINEVLVEHFIQ